MLFEQVGWSEILNSDDKKSEAFRAIGNWCSTK
jgi:hypothetical protein